MRAKEQLGSGEVILRARRGMGGAVAPTVGVVRSLEYIQISWMLFEKYMLSFESMTIGPIGGQPFAQCEPGLYRFPFSGRPPSSVTLKTTLVVPATVSIKRNWKFQASLT